MDVRRRSAHYLGYFASLTLVNCHPDLKDFELQIPAMGFHPCNVFVWIGPFLLVLIYPSLVPNLPAKLLRSRLLFLDLCLLWLAASDSSVAK